MSIQNKILVSVKGLNKIVCFCNITISYDIKSMAKFIATSLSNLVDNLTEGTCNLNVKIVIVLLNMKVSRII